MRLDCLGSGHAFSHGRYWSGYLVNGRVLLDCPVQTLAHLYRLGDAVPAQLDLVLLTHAHSDHIGGMDLLLLDQLQGRTAAQRDGRPLAVAAPPGMYDRLREVIGPSERLPQRDDPRVHWFEQPAGDAFEWAGVRIEAVAMEHDPALDCHGYRLHIDGGIVAYTGDTRMCDAVLRLAAGADVLVVECGGDRRHHHMEWPDVFALRERLAASTEMLVTHYDHREAPDVSSIPGLTLARDFATYEY